jgi:hypothetical protein
MHKFLRRETRAGLHSFGFGRLLQDFRSVCRIMPIVVTGTALWVAAVSHVRAGTTFYTTQSSFQAAAPSLTVENFVKSTSGLVMLASPLASGFPGFNVSTLNPGSVNNALETLGSPGGAHSVGTSWFQDTLLLNFPSGVSAVGETVFGGVYGPLIDGSSGTVTEDVYSGNTLLGSKTISLTSGTSSYNNQINFSANGYIGVTSTSPNITQVQLLFTPTPDLDSNTFVANVAFAPVPEPSTLLLLIGGSGILAVGYAGSRRCRSSLHK